MNNPSSVTGHSSGMCGQYMAQQPGFQAPNYGWVDTERIPGVCDKYFQLVSVLWPLSTPLVSYNLLCSLPF